MDRPNKRKDIHIGKELLLNRVIVFNMILPKVEPARPQIDIYDKYGTLVASGPPSGLGREIQTR